MNNPLFMEELRGESRTISTPDRSCINCIRHHSCCNEVNTGFSFQFPPLWQLRESWEPLNVVPYLKRIVGGICRNFQHTDSYQNHLFVNAEIKRLNAKEQPEWEVN
jgi:hypothetical protein